MKLHLPTSLRKALLSALFAVAAVVSSYTADAAVMFGHVTQETYTDFGQNCGRYVAGRVNDLLDAIRKEEGGITITYQGGGFEDVKYVIDYQQGMIDFASASSISVDAAIGYGFQATVAHNNALTPTYTANEVGDNYAVHYSGIEYKQSAEFHIESATDYKIARLNKLVTDAQPSELFSGTPEMLNESSPYIYRAGSGSQSISWLRDDYTVGGDGQSMALPYTYITGGLVTLSWVQRGKGEVDDNFSIFHTINTNMYIETTGKNPVTGEMVGLPNPLPYVARGGDSGSPSWVWNPETESYQYLSAAQSVGQWFTQDRGSLKWSAVNMEKWNVNADLGGSGANHQVRLYAVTEQGETISGTGDGVPVSTTVYRGRMEYSGSDNETVTEKFIGVRDGVHTWLNLDPVKDRNDWFGYDDSYFNAEKYLDPATSQKQLGYPDLYMTNSLVLKAADSVVYDVELRDNVDLGIGFVQFTKAADYDGEATFKLHSAAGHAYVLDSAGFAVDKGVTLELDLKNPADHMAEWRKAGEGNLRITGEGNTNALLNVGGSGTVSLERSGGYAAYNVLASAGANLEIKDLQQVYRDVTLGANGATLDLQVDEFEWNNSATADANGFKSLHMLVEKDVLTNTSDKTLTVTIKDADARFVGAFEDTKQGAINVVYDSDKTWTMNTVFTDLTKNETSSFTVASGSVTLEGVNTRHGMGSMGEKGASRLVNQFDWHYADAKMNVTVEEDAEFTLGSHARLKGNVTVEDNGVFNMTEYTTHQWEYLEGGQALQDTYVFREFFGLHGDIHLEGENSLFNVQFTPEHYYQATDSESVYDGNITGRGSMAVDTAGGSLVLKGKNTFSGEKALLRGTLIVETTDALGDTGENKWQIADSGVLVVHGTGLSAILDKVDGDMSTGVVALTQNETGNDPDLSGYQQLIIGAEAGKKIEFGERDTVSSLATNEDNQWILGGGGGELVVNYKLDNKDGVLVLGNKYTTGIVTLTNSNNQFSRIDLVGGVTLKYEDERALGKAEVALEYGNRVIGSASLITSLTTESEGSVLLDNMREESVDLTTHGSLSLSADKATVFTGTIDMGENTTYHFGGGGGKLTLDTELTDGSTTARNMVVDGQFYRPAVIGGEQDFVNGEVELKRALSLTGDVTVQGYDMNHVPDGDIWYVWENYSTITLQLSTEDALATVQHVYLNDGGLIDVNGTKQTLHSLMTTDDVVLGMFGILDSSADQTGELVLDVKAGEESSRWKTVLGNIATPNLTKTGSGTLEMENVTESRLFTIEAGTVKIMSTYALNDAGVTRVTGEGILDVSQLKKALDGISIVLDEGGTMLVGTNTVGGRITAEKGSGIVEGTSDTTTLSATIGAAEGATLVLKGQTFRMTGASHNTAGGTIDLQANQLTLANGTGVSIGGTLAVNHDATLHNEQNGASHSINRLQVGEAANLTISGENGRAATWNIHELAGNGSVTWKASNTDVSRMVLDGSNSFDGSLMVERSSVNTAGRAYRTFVEVAHDEALQHIDLTLNGKVAEAQVSVVTLAVNTDNAMLRGLSGNAQSAIYAGASMEGETSPVSARKSTLTVTGSGEQTFAGNVYGVGENAGLTLVKDGQGTQRFSGEEVSVLNAVAKQGRLELTSSHLNIADTATIYRGATLSTGNTFTLKEGETLAVTGEGSQTATLNSALSLNGGVLSFDGNTLRSDAAALTVNSLNTNGRDELTVAFTNASALQTGVTYQLADGNYWNNLTYSADGLAYLDAEFGKENGLSISFKTKDGNLIWQGDKAQSEWNASTFGKDKVGAMDQTTAVFNDLAESKTVSVKGDRTAKALLFDNTEDYVLTTTAGSLQTGDVTLSGTGKVSMGAGVVSTGNVAVGDGSTLTVQGGDTLKNAQSVSGEGKLLVDLGTGGQAALGAQVKELNELEIVSGTVTANATLGTAALKVGEGATLRSGMGEVASAAAIQLAGTLEMEVAHGQTTTLTTGIEAGQKALTEGETDGKGTLVKSGAGTLYVRSDIAADTVRVEGGQLRVEVDKKIESFLTNVDRLEVQKGALAYIGHNACNINVESYVTDMTVDGGTLELAAAQRYTDTVSGDVKVINGGKLSKIDGGLRFTGEVQLGANAADGVTLYGNWGKGGMIFEGIVSGEGNVQLTHGGQGVETYTFAGESNTFNGTYEVAGGVRLLATSEQAIATAENIKLNGGSLVLGNTAVALQELNGTAAASVVTENVGDVGTLTVTKGGTYAGSIGAGVSLVKKGSETLALTGNSNAFGGTVSVKEGTLSIGSDAATSAAMLNQASEVRVAADATLKLGSAVTLKTENADEAVIDGAVSFVVDGTTATMEGDGSTRLDHALIDLAADTTLHLQNVVLGHSSRLTDDSATVAVSNVTFEAVKGINTELTTPVQLASSPAAGEPATADAVITLTNIEKVTITGEHLTIALGGFRDEDLAPYSMMGITLADNAEFGEGLDVLVTYNGNTVGTYYAGENYGTAYFNVGDLVPEPSTATLSLLALAALAARRRRS